MKDVTLSYESSLGMKRNIENVQHVSVRDNRQLNTFINNIKRFVRTCHLCVKKWSFLYISIFIRNNIERRENQYLRFFSRLREEKTYNNFFRYDSSFSIRFFQKNNLKFNITLKFPTFETKTLISIYNRKPSKLICIKLCFRVLIAVTM